MLSKRLVISFCGFLCFYASYSQFIEGKIVDAETNLPVPYVNVWYKGTSVGTYSNGEGVFRLPVNDSTMVSFSSIGYQRLDYRITTTDYITIQLIPDPVILEDVVVKPDHQWKEEVLGYASGKKHPFIGITFWEYKKQFWKIIIPNSKDQQGFITRLHLGILDHQPKQGVLVVDVYLTASDEDKPLLAKPIQFNIDLEDLDDEIIFDLENYNLWIKEDVNVYLSFIGVRQESSFQGGLLDVQLSRKSPNTPRLFHRSSKDDEWGLFTDKNQVFNFWMDVDIKE